MRKETPRERKRRLKAKSTADREGRIAKAREAARLRKMTPAERRRDAAARAAAKKSPTRDEKLKALEQINKKNEEQVVEIKALGKILERGMVGRLA
jgi:hypothetical protein